MKLPKDEVSKKLAVSLRLLGRDRNTIETYTRTAGKFYDFDRAVSPLEQFAPQLAIA